MAEVFDPYYIWLGIPPEEQPADHYRLLGIRRFESNDEVIANAADQRVRHLRSMQAGKRQAETQKLLNEISAASGTLLDPDRRKEYDAKLKGTEAAKQPTAKPTPVVTARPLQVAAPLMATTPAAAISPSMAARPPTGPSAQAAPRKSSQVSPALIAIGAISGLLLVVAVAGLSLAFLGNGKKSETAGPVHPNQTTQSDKSKTAPPTTIPNQAGTNTIASPAKTVTPTPPPVTPKEVSQKAPPDQTDVSRTPKNTGVNLATKDGKFLNIRPLKKVDLLATDRTVLAGELSTKDGTQGVITGGNNPDRAEFPFVLPAAYMVETTLTRLRGEDTIIFGLMVGGHPTSLVLDGYSGIGPWSGLELVSGQRITDADQVTAVKGKQFTNGQRSSLRVFVLSNLVIAELDGRRIVEWSGEAASLDRDPGHATPNAKNFSLATWGSSYHIESLEIIEIGVIEKPRPGESPDIATGSLPNQQVQLGKPVDILKETKPKIWTGAELKDGQILTSSPSGSLAMIVMDYVPQGEYLVEMGATRTSGVDGILLALTLDGRPFTVSLDCFIVEGRGGLSGLEHVDGKRLTAQEHPAVHRGKVLKNGERSQIQVAVRKGHIMVQVDGKILIDWKGDASRLSRSPLTLFAARERLGIGSWQSTYVVDSLKVFPILGQEGDVAVANSGNPVSSPADPPDEKSPGSVAPPPAKAKSPRPGDAALVTAKEKVQETFVDSLAKSKKPLEKLALARELVAVAESERDVAVRYALLDRARNLAVEGQDFATAIAVAQSMAAQYEIDESQLKLETLKLAGGAALPASVWESAAELAAELASAAQALNNLELADAASQLAVEHAGRGKSAEVKKRTKQLRESVAARLTLWEGVRAGEKTLQTAPGDPAANLTVGKWNCLYLGDWDRGLPQLAQGGDAKLAAAAAAERDADEKEAQLLPAADAWSTAAEGLTGEEKLAAQRHALELYQEASEKLKGLEQLKAAKRVTELGETLAQSDSPLHMPGGMVPRPRLTTDVLRPGLLVRVYASQPPKLPTPALGVIRSYGDFLIQREQLVRELKYDAERLCFAGVGYIDLDQDESLLFHVRNGILLVDGNRVIANNPAARVTTGPKKKNKNPDQVRRTLKQGRHTLQVLPYDYTVDGPHFRITQDNGESVILYSPDDLEAELAKPVSLHGVSVKGKFSLGNR